MNDYYLPSETYAPVHAMHNFYSYESSTRACFATVDDYGNLTPAPMARWYSLNT